MRTLLTAAGLTSALGLAACQPKVDAQAPPAESAAAPAAAPATAYTCDDGVPVLARYPDPTTAIVDYQGRTLTLKSAMAASGVRYVGEGLQWWTKGPDATRAPLKPGEDIAGADPVQCWSGEPPAVEPPAPGEPGGLPDDRTPISEAPFTPQSAQGAANVVQTFYAHLSEGKPDEAAKLLRGATPPDLDRYLSYNAQVGAPGEIEGAAGSLFVEVPVVSYARLKTGQEEHRSGKAVLRRVNDVPGSTAEQRAWRIERIDLK